MISKHLLLTYLYLLVYILLSSGVILYNKWVLSPKYFNFPFPITLTMIHMGFSGLVAFLLIRVFKVVSPVKMTFEIYATCVIPISAFFASSLWFGNTAYLFISVAFIQMLKALMPVATFLMAVICGTDKLRCDLFLNMLLVSFGVVISSYGEIHFNVVGTAYQVTGIVAEALRLVLTQVLLQKKGLTLNPITSLYYIAPCREYREMEAKGYQEVEETGHFQVHGIWVCNSDLSCFCKVPIELEDSRIIDFKSIVSMIFFVPNIMDNIQCFLFLFIPWYLLEMPEMQVSQIQFNIWIFFSNALCALALNFSIFLVIGRTGAVTIRVAGVLKDWILIALSTVIFPESTITKLNIIGYAIALCGVVVYNYLKAKDVRSPQSPRESITERAAKDLKTEKKSSDLYFPDENSNNRSHIDANVVDEEAPLIHSSKGLSARTKPS
ncbi:hypothetical protein BUALT_Bualt14G0008600 [Buddleja alternifolia]|uniref:Sugar phosphate transporter domain-containing protein n=1 Tax=Buddleja alternifolia TaxID=168488 RepID=A0AAV6WH73_9LAMI|nr:hypothetical protein BUALT_Bualt14G0008600 [Buddleja alternifolia]